MKKIRSNNTSPEILLRKGLWARNIRYRINDKRHPGKPDITISKYKVAIFIDGEFWHGYKWKVKKKKIKANRGYWIPKIEKNIARDKRYNFLLKKQGWKVIRFWEKEIKKNIDQCIKLIMNSIYDKV